MDLNRLIETFQFIQDPLQRYEVIIDLGKSLPEFSENNKLEEHLVKGCQSKVWLIGEQKDNKTWFFYADADAFIAKGLVAIALLMYNGKNTQEIMQFDESELFSTLNLQQHLSPARSNGFHAMLQKIKNMVSI